MFIATYTDFSDNADGHARLLGVYESASDAATAADADMAGYIHQIVQTGKWMTIDWAHREA